MDWNKTKSIFIIVFLILNIFLLTMFVQKHQTSQFAETSIEETSIEVKLKEDKITYPDHGEG